MSDHNPNFHQRRSIRLKGYDYSKAGLYFITMCVQNRDCLFGDIRSVGVVGAPDGSTVGASLRGRPDISEIQDAKIEEKGTHIGVPLRKWYGQNDIREMILNDSGKMIIKWYNELENKYPNIRCHEMVVMPNHFHCIVEITREYGYDHSDGIGLDDSGDIGLNDSAAHVGAPLRGRPDDPNYRPNDPNYRFDDHPIADPDHNPINDPNDHPITDYNPINETQYGPDNKNFGATIGDVVDWFKTMTTNEYIRGVKNLGWKRFDGKLWQRNYWEHIIRNDDSYHQISEYIIQNPMKWNDDQLNPDQKY